MTIVMTPKAAGLFIASALVAGWLIGTVTTQEAPATAPSRVPPRPLGSNAPSVAPYTQKLRDRLKEQPSTPQRGRNPFTYGSRSPFPAAGSSRRAASVEPDPAPPPMPAERAPRFKLSGIASSQDGGASVLTAIVSDGGVMVLARVGDKLPSGCTVVRIDETSITLADPDGVTQTIRLP